VNDNAYTKEQQAQLDAKWKEIEATFAKSKTHAVCPRVLMVLLAEDGVTWRLQWTKEMTESCVKLVDATKQEKSHKKAIEDLIYMAAFVQHELGREELAMGLMMVLNDAVVRFKLVDLDAEGKFDKDSDDIKAKAVTGGKGRAVPAKVGEKAPDGTLRPDLLKGGKRRI
jgi:hypothetical protein